MIERRKFLTATIALLLAPTAKLLGKEEVYIRDRVFKGQTLNVEGKKYFNCHFENCRFIGQFNLLQKCIVTNCHGCHF